MKKKSITEALIYIISAELVGAISALLTGGFSDFYDQYKEPPLLPPQWVFPVVWTVLYAVMGYSAYLISRHEDGYAKRALTLYWTQLAVNFSWSIMFFRFEAMWAAFGILTLLIVLTAMMMRAFKRVEPAAAYLNIPYILWLLFAAYLNFAAAYINR